MPLRPNTSGLLRGLATVALVAIALAMGARAVAAPEDTDGSHTRRVKAGFLYQFLGYVEWPAHAFADSASPVVIGVLGGDAALAEVKDAIADRLAQGRAPIVRRVRDGDPLSGIHLLYVTRPETSRVAALAREARQSATLIVTEADGALESGSAINFRLVDGHVRFDIAPAHAEQAGLRISSRLLTVAQTVRTPP